MVSNEVFAQLLEAARAQAHPQRLIFLFARRELPAAATAAQQHVYARGDGGALQPLGGVDKSPDELTTFAELAAEADAACPDWDVVFVAALTLQDRIAYATALVDDAMKRMVAAVHGGRVAGLLCLNAQGQPLQFAQ